MAAKRLQSFYIYLPIIIKYGFNEVATARLVPKLDTYDTNVSIRYISGSKQYRFALVATEVWRTIFTNWAKIGHFRHIS